MFPNLFTSLFVLFRKQTLHHTESYFIESGNVYSELHFICSCSILNQKLEFAQLQVVDSFIMSCI